MNRRISVFCVPFLVFFLAAASAADAAYLFPGDNSLQPLVDIEAVAPGTLIKTWKAGDTSVRRWRLGFTTDVYRNREDSGDIDTIAIVTGGWSPSRNMSLSLVQPYLVRDPEFNESGLLDMRFLVRHQLHGAGEAAGFRAAWELGAVFPTGEADPVFPLSIDSNAISVRFALSFGTEQIGYGFNGGYRIYSNTEAGDDSDRIYGGYLDLELGSRWRGIAELAGSTHIHSGSPGDDSVSDNTLMIGAVYHTAGGYRWTAGVGGGLGDSFADGRLTLSTSVPLGETCVRTAEAQQQEPGRAGIVIRLINRSGSRRAGRKVQRALRKEGYSVVVLEESGDETQPSSVLIYAPVREEKAIRLGRILGFRRIVEGVRLEKSDTLQAIEVMILIIGADAAE